MQYLTDLFSLLREKRSLGNLTLPRGWWLFAFGLFLYAQTASLIHAEIHPFHAHSEECDAYQQAAEPRVDTPFFQFQLPSVETPLFQPSLYLFQPQAIAYRSYSVRAPPLSITT